MAHPVGAVPGARSPRRRSPRRRGIRGWIFLAFLIVPVLEIAAIISVGRVIGGWQTIALIVLMSIIGTWLIRREGARTWRALTAALSSGAMPSRELADAALVLMGGTLLLTPGFLTDIVGMLFILPATRPISRRILESLVASRLLGAATAVPRAAGPPAGGPRAEGSPGHTGPGADTVPGHVVER